MRIIVMQVDDAKTEDDLRMALAIWNDQNGEDRQVAVRFMTSFVATEHSPEVVL